MRPPDLAHAAGRDPGVEAVAAGLVDVAAGLVRGHCDHRLHDGLGDRAAEDAAGDLVAARCRSSGSSPRPRPAGRRRGRRRRTRRTAAGRPLCAVPVLPATSTPGIAAGVAVPSSTVATISSVSSSAVVLEIASRELCGSVLSSTSRSGGADLVDEVGPHHRRRRWRCRPPPSPSAAAWRAPRTGRCRTSAVCGSSMSLGEDDCGLRGRGRRGSVVEAERLGLLGHRLGAELVGEAQKVVLQETSSAWVSGSGRCRSRGRRCCRRSSSVCGSWKSAPPGTIESAS